jgi:hypothetical protein
MACTDQSEARGRHHWFRIAETVLIPPTYGAAADTQLFLHLSFRRRWQIALVVLVLTAADAAALAPAVQDAVQQLCPVPPADRPFCPRCLATEALASGVLTVESMLVVQDAACLTCRADWYNMSMYSGSGVQDA